MEKTIKVIVKDFHGWAYEGTVYQQGAEVEIPESLYKDINEAVPNLLEVKAGKAGKGE